MIGIYKIISPSGKIYIGQSTNIEQRKDHYKRLNCKNQTKLYNSLKKYGWESHSFDIIEKCTEDKLLERESYWKIYHKVLETPSLCCRMDGKGGYDSNETKLKKSQSSLNKPRSYKGKPKPEGFGDLISKLKKGKPNLKNRKPRSKEFGEFISKARKGKPNPKNATPKPHLRIAVSQYDKQNNFIKNYTSLSEACFYLNKPLTQAGYISQVCKGIKKSAFGYVWKYK
jgi:group I intron endonuclease